MRICSVAKALPPNRYGQDEILAGFREYWGAAPLNMERLAALHRNVQVGSRHLALPMERYPALKSWGDANAAFIEVAVDLGAKAVTAALRRAGVAPERVGAIFFVSVTGIATPSIDARLVTRVGFSPRIKRIPIFGLGCVAGAAGIARAADYVRAFPEQYALLLSVELCSLTLQRGDLSVANLISSGLFGDGAAAVVVAGSACADVGAGPGPAARRAAGAGPATGEGSRASSAPGSAPASAPGSAPGLAPGSVLGSAPDSALGSAPDSAPGSAPDSALGSALGSAPDSDGASVTGSAGPRILDTRSVFYPDTERVMGWDISERGFRIVLSSDVPEVVRNFLRADVDAFLADHGLARADIGTWICHPGGPKVLEAMQDALELPPGALDLTWTSLREVGNLSSASVLFVLHDTLAQVAQPPRGAKGLLLAMGPGFCSELVLLEW